MSSTMSQLPVRQHSAGSLLRPYFQHWMPSTKSCVPPRSLVPQVNAYKSVSIPGTQVRLWDARRELYHPFCNFVREVYLLPLQSCKLFFSELGSPGRGSIRNTTFTWSWTTSTRLTKARIISRFRLQSAS